MQQADHVVRVTVVDRQAGMLTGPQGGEDVMHVILQIDAHHLVARHHDVFHRDCLQIKDIEQHLLVVFWYQAAGLIHHGTQFLGAEVVVALLIGVDACQAQEDVADAVDQPDQRRQQSLQWLEGDAGREGHALWAHGCKGLGGNLGKHQHDDGDHHGCNRSATVTQPANGQNGGHGGGKIVDEVVADQDDRQQPVGALEQSLHPGSRLVPLAGQMTQPVAVDGHHAGFAAGEKG